MENLNALNATTTENTIITKKHFLPLDYLQELEDESQNLTADEIDHHGFMATQYEQYGSIDFKEYLKEVIFENMDDDDILRKYDASRKIATEPKKKKFIPLFASIYIL